MKLSRFVGLIVIIFAVSMMTFAGCSSKKHKSSRGGGGGGGAGTGSSNNPGNDPGSNPANAAQYEQDVFNMVNDERSAAGVGPLQWCDGLAACAKAHSNDMCARGFFDHTNPDGEGPTERGQAGHAGSYTFTPIVSSPYTWIGENIAMGSTTPAETMNMWMNSSGHRANILADFTHIGVGLCDGCGTHWTQNFGIR
ncbi:MAG: CAP domain-containing protein [Planctomycetota bacterium]|nr:MAG: CAP domain-containing protein [Planctomycetota bacterium]